MIAGHCSDVAF